MNAVIDQGGQLIVVAENETEGYALAKWHEANVIKQNIDSASGSAFYRSDSIILADRHDMRLNEVDG